MNMAKMTKKANRLKRSWDGRLNSDITVHQRSRVNPPSQKKDSPDRDNHFYCPGRILMAAIIAPFLTSVLQSNIPEIAASAAFLAAERLEQLHQVAYLNIAMKPMLL